LTHRADIHKVMLSGLYFEFDVSSTPDHGIADKSYGNMRVAPKNKAACADG
jgi:hypothetical protein